MTFTVSPTFRSRVQPRRPSAFSPPCLASTHELSFVVPDQHARVHPFDSSHHAREGYGSAGLEAAKE